METGSVKFSCDQVAVTPPEFPGFAELNHYRRKLWQLRLIGVDVNGIGFGNVSVRNSATQQFYITGSGTGKLSELTRAHYAKVIRYDFGRNWLQCEGTVVASSESLTHAAVYESNAPTMAIIHCHDLKLWAALLNQVPTTSDDIDYGTPDMAYAVQRLFDSTDVRKRKIFAMAAHEGGLVVFGRDLEEAFGILMRFRAMSSEG